MIIVPRNLVKKQKKLSTTVNIDPKMLRNSMIGEYEGRTLNKDGDDRRTTSWHVL